MNDTYYIQKEGYVGNSLLWWRKGGRGYTTNINDAQEYTYTEAKEIIDRPNSDKIMHKKTDVEACAEKHINTESEVWNNYLNAR